MSNPEKLRKSTGRTPRERAFSAPFGDGTPVAFQGEALQFPSRISTWLSSWSKCLALRMAAQTWRKTVQGLDELDERLASGEGCLVVFWHGKYLALPPLLRGRRACVFTSCSHRGSLVAGICSRFGLIPVQIPDAKHDDKLEYMKQALREHCAGAIAVDGPTGPYHFVKRGAVTLASELGYCIVPVSVASDRAHVLSQRWDRMEMPKLFSRVCLGVASAIRVPPNLNEHEVLEWSDVLHDALEALDRSTIDRLRSQ